MDVAGVSFWVSGFGSRFMLLLLPLLRKPVAGNYRVIKKMHRKCEKWNHALDGITELLSPLFQHAKSK